MKVQYESCVHLGIDEHAYDQVLASNLGSHGMHPPLSNVGRSKIVDKDWEGSKKFDFGGRLSFPEGLR